MAALGILILHAQHYDYLVTAFLAVGYAYSAYVLHPFFPISPAIFASA
jgi:hypothetical protein